VEAVRMLSDHRGGSFGEAFGLLIKELRLLARAVIVIDRGGAVGYIEIVKEVTEQPDYDAALDAVRNILDKGEQL
jgi:thiol peroxidase